MVKRFIIKENMTYDCKLSVVWKNLGNRRALDAASLEPYLQSYYPVTNIYSVGGEIHRMAEPGPSLYPAYSMQKISSVPSFSIEELEKLKQEGWIFPETISEEENFWSNSRYAWSAANLSVPKPKGSSEWERERKLWVYQPQKIPFLNTIYAFFLLSKKALFQTPLLFPAITKEVKEWMTEEESASVISSLLEKKDEIAEAFETAMKFRTMDELPEDPKITWWYHEYQKEEGYWKEKGYGFEYSRKEAHQRGQYFVDSGDGIIPRKYSLSPAFK